MRTVSASADTAFSAATEGRECVQAVAPAPAPQPVKAIEPEKPVATAVAPAAAPVVEELAVIATNGHALAAAANGGSAKPANGNGGGGTSTITLNLGATKVSFQTQADAPGCSDCGSIMVRNGSCYKCLNCGSTSGCS